jgi:hypothetical protein
MVIPWLMLILKMMIYLWLVFFVFQFSNFKFLFSFTYFTIVLYFRRNKECLIEMHYYYYFGELVRWILDTLFVHF